MSIIDFTTKQGPTNWTNKEFKPYNVYGIYVIWNWISEKGYVGSSKRMGDRWRDHRNDLIKGRHYNHKLQRSWNKHGKRAFRLYILEYCEENTRTNLETSWIEILNSYENGYNQTPTADISAIWTSEMKKARSESWTDVRKKALSEDKKKKWAEGIIDHSPETREEKRQLFKKLNELGITNNDEQVKRLIERNKSDDMKAKVKAAWTPERREEHGKEMSIILTGTWTAERSMVQSDRMKKWHAEQKQLKIENK